MQIWKFQKIFYFSDPLCLKEEKCRFRCFSRFQDFQLFGPQSLNEKIADLDVLEDFKIFNFLDPLPHKKSKDADLDVSEDFQIFNISDLPKMIKMQIWIFQKIFMIFNFSDLPNWSKWRFVYFRRF